MNSGVDSKQESDNKMPPPTLDPLGVPTQSESLDTINQFFQDSPDPTTPTAQLSATNPPPNLDLLDRMDRTYRLLDLIYEQGVGGAGTLHIMVLTEYQTSCLVEKVMIAQDSVGRFANYLHPRSYTSMTKACFGSDIALSSLRVLRSAGQF